LNGIGDPAHANEDATWKQQRAFNLPFNPMQMTAHGMP
jgi:hypothetical protein